MNGKDPLLYIVIFVFLAVLAIIFLTLLLWFNNKNLGCTNNPAIWCYDDWTCPSLVTGCPNTSVTGLASCLYGISSPLASVCVAGSTGGYTGGTPICGCAITPTGGAGNCLTNCPPNPTALQQTGYCTTLQGGG